MQKRNGNDGDENKKGNVIALLNNARLHWRSTALLPRLQLTAPARLHCIAMKIWCKCMHFPHVVMKCVSRAAHTR